MALNEAVALDMNHTNSIIEPVIEPLPRLLPVFREKLTFLHGRIAGQAICPWLDDAQEPTIHMGKIYSDALAFQVERMSDLGISWRTGGKGEIMDTAPF